MSDLKTAASEITKGVDRLQRFTPDSGSAFRDLAGCVESVGRATPRAKALLGAALGVAGGCEQCARRHAHNAAFAGVERSAFELALERGVLMATGPAGAIAAAALCEFDRTAEARAARPL